tara:strand:- start:1743 stop:2075 length:333 start_codon:yes stop_codon:yes gene_type:complete
LLINGFYAGQEPSWVQKEVEKVLEAHAKTIGLSDFFTVVYEGFQAEGCVMYDEEKGNAKEKEFFETLAKVHEEVNGEKAKYTVATCTTGTTDVCFLPSSVSLFLHRSNCI